MSVRLLKGLPTLIILFSMVIFNTGFGQLKNYLILALFIGYIVLLVYTDKRFLLRYSYIIFYISTNIFGVFLIETGYFYLSELGTYSHENNSLLLLTITHVLFIETVKFFNHSSKQEIEILKNSSIEFPRLKLSKIQLLKIGLFVIFIVFLIMFSEVINKPFFIVGLDRFLYQEQYLSPFTITISNSILYLNALISIYLFYTKSKKVIPLLLLIFTYLLWIGHKFSFFMDMSYLLFLPFIWFGTYKVLKKVLKSSVIIVFVLIIVVSIQSFIVYQRDFNENMDYLKMRLAQQGQLWWATYGLEKDQKNNVDEINDELDTYFKLGLEEQDLYNSGIYKIMKLTTPHEIFERKVYEKNSRYAYSTQATIYYYFKEWGLLIFSVLSGALYYLITTNLIKSIVSIKIIPSILYTRLLIILNRSLLQSDFDKLFSIEVLVIVGILIISNLFDKVFSIRKATI